MGIRIRVNGQRIRLETEVATETESAITTCHRAGETGAVIRPPLRRAIREIGSRVGTAGIETGVEAETAIGKASKTGTGKGGEVTHNPIGGAIGVGKKREAVKNLRNRIRLAPARVHALDAVTRATGRRKNQGKSNPRARVIFMRPKMLRKLPPGTPSGIRPALPSNRRRGKPASTIWICQVR